jgi:hypothetical protein
MKELIVGDIAVYTEDGDTWDDLIEVVRKADKAYLETSRPANKEPWPQKLLGKLFRAIKKSF